jgi:hypothetical protein
MRGGGEAGDGGVCGVRQRDDKWSEEWVMVTSATLRVLMLRDDIKLV